MKNLEKLKIFREYFNLTQEQLAECLGVDRAIISRWENGKMRLLDFELKGIFFTLLPNADMYTKKLNDFLALFEAQS